MRTLVSLYDLGLNYEGLPATTQSFDRLRIFLFSKMSVNTENVNPFQHPTEHIQLFITMNLFNIRN